MLVIVVAPALDPLAKLMIPLLVTVPAKVVLLKSNWPVAVLVIVPVFVKVDAGSTVKIPLLVKLPELVKFEPAVLVKLLPAWLLKVAALVNAPILLSVPLLEKVPVLEIEPLAPMLAAVLERLIVPKLVIAALSRLLRLSRFKIPVALLNMVFKPALAFCRKLMVPLLLIVPVPPSVMLLILNSLESN